MENLPKNDNSCCLGSPVSIDRIVYLSSYGVLITFLSDGSVSHCFVSSGFEFKECIVL